MAVFGKIFGGKETTQANAPASSGFHESDTVEGNVSRGAQRRELIKVVLRDTIRKHGIPSDWIACQIISAVNRKGTKGMHVQLVVRKSHEELLGYLFAFQESFLREIAKFEPRSDEWLFSVGWQFLGAPGHRVMPSASTWGASTFGYVPAAASATTAPMPPASLPPAPSPITPVPTLEPSPGASQSTGGAVEALADDDIELDLKALFEIRDAAIRATAESAMAGEQPDFEDTHPSTI